MITVRFPTGFSVQYNDLDYVDFRNNGAYLGKRKEPNSYNVWAPLDCIIEHISPCRTYNPTISGSDEVKSQLDMLAREIRSLKRKLAKR